MPALVLVIVIVTKFTKGAYLVLIAMPILYVLMRAINRHYTRVASELDRRRRGLMLPARNHVVVLVSKLHKPTLRALAYARATRPDTLTALTVNVDDDETRALLAEWERHDLPVQLTVLESPYREITRRSSTTSGSCARTAARRRQRLHPRVRGRALVGAPAAQPVRAAAQGPAAVPARRDGHQRAVAAGLLPAAGGLGGSRHRGRPSAARPGPAIAPTMPPVRRPRRLDPLSRTSRAVQLGRNDAVMAGPELASASMLELDDRRGGARRALRGPRRRDPTVGWCSSGTRCPASGCGPWSPRTRGGSFCRADAVEVLAAVAGPGRRRPARTPARAAAAAATGSTRPARRSAS